MFWTDNTMKSKFPSHSGLPLLVSDILLQRGSMPLHTQDTDIPFPHLPGACRTGFSSSLSYPLFSLTMKVNSSLFYYIEICLVLSNDCVVFHCMDTLWFNWSFIYIYLGCSLFPAISKQCFHKHLCTFIHLCTYLWTYLWDKFMN